MRQIKKDSTNISIDVYIIDSTDGTPELGVLYNTAGMDLEYRRESAVAVDITEATLAALTTAHTDGGFLEIGHGYYRFDLPDAAVATGVSTVSIQGTVTGMIILPQTFQLVDFDPEDPVRLGLTVLPNVAAGSAGGLPVDTDANGAVRIVDGTGAREVNTNSGAIALVDLVTITTTNTDMVGTSNAALASVCTETRISELDAGTGGKMANQVDVIEGDTTSLNDTKIPDIISLANINTECDTALTDYDALTRTEATSDKDEIITDLDDIKGTSFIKDTHSLIDITTDVTGLNGDAMRGTEGANTTKTGYSLSSTGLDAIVQGATGAIEIAKAIWDRILTGGTHNIANSSGRRFRNLQEFGTYEGGFIFIDTVGGSAGTTNYESGTNLNPVDSITDANTIATSLNLLKFEILPGSSITFAASQDNNDFEGNNWILALGGQSISNSHISGASVSGICSGANEMEFHECFIGNVTVPPCNFQECDMEGTVILPVGGIDFHHCAGSVSFILDYGALIANTTVLLTNFSGDLIVDNLGANGIDILNIRGHGKITLNASCTGGTINWDGHFTVVNNGSGITINKDDISKNVDDIIATVGVAGVGLTDLGGMSTTMKAEINTEADTALTDYDGPTRAESTSDKDEIITQVNANETKIDTIKAKTDIFTFTSTNVHSHTKVEDDLAFGPLKTATISGVGIQKNTALNNFMFLMRNASDHVTGMTGLTVTAERSIDSVSFTGCANTPTEVGSGTYVIDLAASDLNGDTIMFKFTATGADATFIEMVTQS